MYDPASPYGTPESRQRDLRRKFIYHVSYRDHKTGTMVSGPAFDSGSWDAMEWAARKTLFDYADSVGLPQEQVANEYRASDAWTVIPGTDDLALIRIGRDRLAYVTAIVTKYELFRPEQAEGT